MSINIHSRFTAKELMEAAGNARLIIKQQGYGKSFRFGPDGEEIPLDKLFDALEYIYRFFSMFAWLTLGGNSIDDHFVLEKLSLDLKIEKKQEDDDEKEKERG